MGRLLWDVLLLLTGSILTMGQVLENSTTTSLKRPLAAAVRSHFDDCPDSHRHFCFHGTCRFLVQEEIPACVCHAGFVGMRCEHADLLAVVANNHKQQTMATLLVLCVIGCVSLILLCALLHCCRQRGICNLGHEKAGGVLWGGVSCCHTETV